jgi:hypothetical protein
MLSDVTVMLRSTRRVRLEARIAAVAALFLLAGCHGGTLDAIYPGTLGHDPPPAINLPPQDQGMGMIAPTAPPPAGIRP